MSVNKVMLIGRLGTQPEVRFTPSGAAVANFTLATNESWNDKNGQKQEKTEWHRIVVWGKLAQLCGEYLSKGRQVFVEGKLQTRQWQDKEGQTKYTTEIIATTVQFLGSNQERGSYASDSSRGASDEAPAGGNGALEEPSFTEEDIPF